MSNGRLQKFYRYCRERLSACFDGRPKPDVSVSSSAAASQPGKSTGQGTLEEALALHQQGNLDVAESAYRGLLGRNPDNFNALHLLGVLQAQRKQLSEAAELLDRAIAIEPGNAAVHATRGKISRAMQRNQDALASYDRALALDPGNAEAMSGRSAVLSDLGRHEDALEGYDRLLTVKPDNHDAWFNRGIALAALRRYEDAVASYERALAAKSDSAEVLNNRGIALACLGRLPEALSSYDQAITLNPEYAEAWNNRGALLADMGRHDEALTSYDRALAIRPDSAGFLNNRAGLFRLMENYGSASQDYARVLELEPGFEQALSHKLHADIQICSWRHYDADRKKLEDYVRDGGRAFPFSVLVLTDSPALQLACARNYAMQKYPSTQNPLWAGERYHHKRIRIAYLSADFYLHATAHLMAELFERHDRERFEVSAWSFGPDVKDAMRDRLQKSFEKFNDVRDKSDDEIAAMLRAQEIDIAVDLKGYSKWSRPGIFAKRAAPIQVNYLVYPGTTGAGCMDYIIGDAEVIPDGHDAFYAENVVRMPDSYQVNGSRRVIAERTPARADAGLPETGFVFCCFNNNYKITPDVFAVWMRLLGRVEGSVLWLLEGNEAASRNLKAEAQARGITADRLVFAPRMPPPEHLARHRLAGLFLDTLPCNAHTTASDALWAGLPVLTCRGHAFPGRVAASLLRAVGLPELITENLAGYEALALELATSPGRLAEIKSRLEQNRMTQPLFDIERYRRHVESAYALMHERYQQGGTPQGFSVPRLP